MNDKELKKLVLEIESKIPEDCLGYSNQYDSDAILYAVQKTWEEFEVENKKLREALEFYANPSNYSLSTHIRPRVKSTQRILTEKDLSEIPTQVLPVGGKRAREALKETKEN
jgi:hypothetical protein